MGPPGQALLYLKREAESTSETLAFLILGEEKIKKMEILAGENRVHMLLWF